MRRAVVLLGLAACAGLAIAPAASATGECKGLKVCVRIAGPWVVVPVAAHAPQPAVQFTLACPRGYIVGGLDAEVSRRGIDVGFIGALGSPVNPGITTAQSAVFTGIWSGASPSRVSFRPHLGCIPTSGGGQPVPTAYHAGRIDARQALAPAKPTVRHVRTTPLGPGTTRVTQGCAAGEHLVAAYTALAFYTPDPPAPAIVAGIQTQASVSNGRLVVTVREGGLASSSDAVVQLQAVCAGGS